jgi:hypothetical protein
MAMKMQSGIGAKLHMRGRLEYKNKDGQVIKTVEINGSAPLAELGLSEQEAKRLVASQTDAQPATKTST